MKNSKCSWSSKIWLTYCGIEIIYSSLIYLMIISWHKVKWKGSCFFKCNACWILPNPYSSFSFISFLSRLIDFRLIKYRPLTLFLSMKLSETIDIKFGYPVITLLNKNYHINSNIDNFLKWSQLLCQVMIG